MPRMIIDTTLREGAQQFGTNFPLAVRQALVDGLLNLGVDEIELGWVGQDSLPELAAWARARVGERRAGTALSVWTTCREADIRAAADLGLDRVNMGVPVSDPHIKLRLGMDRSALLENLARGVLYAKLLGVPYLSVGLEDVSRTGVEFALGAARLAGSMGASRVRLADTVGLMTPLGMADLVRGFREALGPDMDLAAHCHDDLGMATANAFTALEAGADFADASLLGLGERAGISATEELTALLCLRKGRAYGLDGLRELCALAADQAGVEIPRFKAVAGADIFSCESGLHAHGLHKSPALFEPFDPALLGMGRTIRVGGKSGRAAIEAALRGLGLERNWPDPALLVDAVHRAAANLGRPLTEDEFRGMAAARHKAF